MKLFEYAIIYRPHASKEQRDNGERAKAVLIGDVTRAIAGDEREALMLAARDIPTEYADKLDRIDIALRPF